MDLQLEPLMLSLNQDDSYSCLTLVFCLTIGRSEIALLIKDRTAIKPEISSVLGFSHQRGNNMKRIDGLVKLFPLIWLIYKVYLQCLYLSGIQTSIPGLHRLPCLI